MKLLVLSNFYPPHTVGGMEYRCQETVLGLQQRGHTVAVLTSRYGMTGGRSHRDEEASVTRALYLENDVAHYRPVAFFLQRAGQERANLLHLRQALQNLQPDGVMVWGMWNLSPWLAYWAEQWLPGRVAYSIASYWPVEETVHETYWRAPARRQLSETLKRPLRALAFRRLRREGYPPPLAYAHVACCSPYLRDTLVQVGTLPAHTIVIYGGIDPAPFVAGRSPADRFNSEPLRLLYFGSLTPHKGVETAIEALALLKGQGRLDHLSLTILGGGHPQYVTHLRDLTAQSGLEDKVSFAGKVNRSKIPDWLRQHDVALFTSTWGEPLARTVMEAMASGLLVIGCPVGGQAEMLLAGQTALTFPAGDAQGLARQIVYALDHPREARRLAQQGQDMITQRFILDRMVDEMEAWLQGICLLQKT